LVKALMFDVPNFLDKSIPSDLDRTSLIYDKVWPLRFIPDIQDNPKSLITTEWSFKPYTGDSIKITEVILYAICHISLMSVDGGMRKDFMVAEINKSIKNCSLFKSGNLTFQGGGDFLADAGGKWYGTFIRYAALTLSR